MECVEIRGGRPLRGRVEIQGSKNAVLPILAACILHEGRSRIYHCPRIRDVYDTIVLLESLGCRVWWEGDCLTVDASVITGWSVPEQITSRMRSSVLFLGALLGRMGRAGLCYPGGCVLGERPIDLHIFAMRALGALVEEERNGILARAERLKGSEIRLAFPSVGATENAILAAVLAEGETVIHNAAREPEIAELCLFLREKGADVQETSHGKIRIRGQRQLKDSGHYLSSDRIVAGTYMIAAAVTGGRIELGQMPEKHMGQVISALEHTGVRLKRQGGTMIVDGTGQRRGIGFLETAPYPGFPTDLQSPMMTLLSVSEGESRIRENIFEARFKAAGQLQKMGAQIRLSGKDAVIRGVERLCGAEVRAEELRGAAALFLAGLHAEGTTKIHGCHFISRGYEDICGNLQKLGADISACGEQEERRGRQEPEMALICAGTGDKDG